jgi:hypothetical protein
MAVIAQDYARHRLRLAIVLPAELPGWWSAVCVASLRRWTP